MRRARVVVCAHPKCASATPLGRQVCRINSSGKMLDSTARCRKNQRMAKAIKGRFCAALIAHTHVVTITAQASAVVAGLNRPLEMGKS